MAASDLDVLQRHFLHYILTGQQEAIHAALAGSATRNIDQQLAVYGHGYRLRFLGVLADTFKLTKRLLGEAPFEALARVYIEGIRSHHFAIDTINDDFAASLAAAGQPLLAEVATIERCIDHVLRAPSVEQLTLAQLQQQARKGLADYRLAIHPSLKVLTLNSSAMTVWQAYWHDQPLPMLQAQPPHHWLLWLRDGYPRVRLASTAEVKMVTLVQSGHTFAEICQVLCHERSPAQAAEFAGGRLQQWIGEALLATTRD